MKYKAITICQPWAWAIIHGPKRIENRTWPSDYHGPLLIHAGKSEKYWSDGIEFLSVLSIALPCLGDVAWGEIIGVVDMVGCMPVHQAKAAGMNWPFAEGPWCHIYENPRAFLEPIPYRGRQRLFGVPDHVVAAQMSATPPA